MAGITGTRSTEDEAPLTFSEDTPLLSGAPAPAPAPFPAAIDDQDPRTKYKWRVLVGAFSIVFIIELAIGISTPAWYALLEKGICAEAYPDIARFLVAGDDNPLCKEPAVQEKLAMYRGWAATLDCVPTILLALPYGALTDRWGRRPIALMSLVGIALGLLWYEVVFYFPLPMWMFTLSFAFNFLGGGAAVAVSAIYTMLADVLHVEEVTPVLFRFYAIFLLAELVSNPLGGFLLSKGAWLTLLIGNVFMVLVIASVYILPETLVVRQWHDKRAGKVPSPRPSPLDDDDAADEEGLKKSNLSAALDDARTQLVEVWDFLLGNRRLVMLMLPLIFVSLGKYVLDMLLQYSTKRFGWSWSTASYFLSLKSASFIAMLLLFLPALSSFCLNQLRMSPLSKDVWLSRWSVMVYVAANLVIAFSYNPALFGIGLVLLSGGSGLVPLLRSLLNAQVEPHHVGILNTLLGFLDTLGVMAGTPVFTWAMHEGIKLGGGWLGLPFLAGAVISSFAAGILWVYRIPPQVERSLIEEDHV